MMFCQQFWKLIKPVKKIGKIRRFWKSMRLMVLKKRIISIITRVNWYILSRMSVLTVPFIGLIQIQKEQSALKLSGMQGEKSRVLLI
ncbi:hypothetical protein IMSAGC019_03993 [Lachnospiraceae bacterium]|nr:hypothetical protein IMSAGC019_03993 [Lachnospiraceae bacterium]